MSEFASEGGESVVEQPEAAAPENVVEENAAEATPAAEPETLSFDPTELQAENKYIRQQNGELMGILEQLASQQGQPVQQTAQQAGYDISNITDEYGNLDPQKFAAFQAQRDQALLGQIGQMFQPLQQTFASQQEAAIVAEGEQRLQDILHDDVSRNGDFVRATGNSDAEVQAAAEANQRAHNLVTTLASQLFPDNAQRYGNGPRAAEISMNQAAAEVRSLLQSAGGAAVTQTQNQLATLAGAHGEPGPGGAGVSAPVIRIGETSAAKFAAGGSNG